MKRRFNIEQIHTVAVVSTNQEQWIKNYEDALAEDLVEKPNFQPLEGTTILTHEVIGLEVITSYEKAGDDYATVPGFNEYWNKVVSFGIELAQHGIDQFHITEAASVTSIGKVMLDTAMAANVEVVIIPEDLSDGLNLDDAEAMK